LDLHRATFGRGKVCREALGAFVVLSDHTWAM
jgi:hypothetical protein